MATVLNKQIETLCGKLRRLKAGEFVVFKMALIAFGLLLGAYHNKKVKRWGPLLLVLFCLSVTYMIIRIFFDDDDYNDELDDEDYSLFFGLGDDDEEEEEEEEEYIPEELEEDTADFASFTPFQEVEERDPPASGEPLADDAVGEFVEETTAAPPWMDPSVKEEPETPK
ncbi:MAG: hypothetical protein FWF06_04595 [Symbiobacteriaceae bacterium]|nr:hypothetical protein [Symbiobacteriaceae bacterium]